jgi:molybdate transport system ATP-binding protein
LARRLTRAASPRLDAIRLERVSLRLGRHWALRDVSFELRAGERWLLSGLNGSGKSVLLKLLRGDLWPTPTGRERRQYLHDGEWHDEPLFARERIAYLSPERQDRYERHGFDSRVADVVATGFTGDDLLLDQPSATQWRAVREALRGVGLAGLSGRRFLTLSHGQRRRVLLARALVGRPDVLLLDEVLNGLDAASRRLFMQSLRRVSGPDVAWILTTHRLGERPRGITHAAHLERGKLQSATVAQARRKRRAVAPAAGGGRSMRRISAGAAAGRDAIPLLQLRHASVYRDGHRVLGPLDWTIETGEHWHVAGTNGAGKSTLIALLYGDLSPADGGRIERQGCPPGTPISEWKCAVGIVSPELQSRYASTACTVEEIVVSGLHSSIGLDEPPSPVERELARRSLAAVGLRGLGRRRARELSYGQLRRALLARALVVNRRLLLLDEPFDGLDAPARDIVAAQVAAAVRRGTQVVLATHHPEDVPAYVTRRLMLPVRREAGRRR